MNDKNNELTTVHFDHQLRRDLEEGRITQAEVDAVWAATWDLSPQTPLPVRKTVAAMRETSAGKTPEQAMALMFPMLADFLMTAMTETQGALMRDESKFAHLVAGTEAIVKTMQDLNPLNRRLERIEDAVHSLAETLEKMVAAKAPPADPDRDQSPKGAPQDFDENCICDCPENTNGHTIAEHAQLDEATPDPEQEANKARAGSIGSAWAKPPDQGPLTRWVCPLGDCDYSYIAGKEPAHEELFRCFRHQVRLVHETRVDKTPRNYKCPRPGCDYIYATLSIGQKFHCPYDHEVLIPA